MKKDINNRVNFTLDFGYYISGLLLDCLIFACNIKNSMFDLSSFALELANIEEILIVSLFIFAILPIICELIYKLI